MSSTSLPAARMSAPILAILKVEVKTDLRSTLQALEHGDRAWGYNLCRAVECLWTLGAIRQHTVPDLNQIQQYLYRESADIVAGLVDRSESEHDLIWQAIAEIYLNISEFKP